MDDLTKFFEALDDDDLGGDMENFDTPGKRPPSTFRNVGADEYFELEKRILDEVGKLVPLPQKGDYGWYFIKYHNAIYDPKIRKQVRAALKAEVPYTIRWPAGFTNGDIYDGMKRSLNKGILGAIPEDMSWSDFCDRWSKGRF